MPGLRHLPEDDVDVASAAAEDRQRLALALRHALRLCAVVAEAEIEDFRAGRRAAHRGVGVQADEQVRLVVVGHGRALVEADGLIGVAREDDARAQAGLDGRLQPPRDAERHVLFERALRSACTVFIAAVAGVDHDRAHRSRRRDVEQRRRLGCGRRGRLLGRRRRLGGLRDDLDDDASRAALAGCIR